MMDGSQVSHGYNDSHDNQYDVNTLYIDAFYIYWIGNFRPFPTIHLTAELSVP